MLMAAVETAPTAPEGGVQTAHFDRISTILTPDKRHPYSYTVRNGRSYGR